MGREILCEIRGACVHEHQMILDSTKTAIVVVDMFDVHWCKTFTLWADDLAPRLDMALKAFRERGVQIIFMADGAQEKYSDAPQYFRMYAYPHLPDNLSFPYTLHPAIPGRWPTSGCVCPEGTCNVKHNWNRIHPALTIESVDLIGEWGDVLHNACHARGFTHLLYCGVATNWCVLDSRTFSMVPMIDLGYHVVLLRDLTEAFVAGTCREEGLHLSVEYTERFIAPTALAGQLLDQ